MNATMKSQKGTHTIRCIVETWAEKLPLLPGGWAESVRPDWTEGPEPKRTMLSQARLAYTFLHAGMLGGGSSDGAVPAGTGGLIEIGRGAADRMMRLFWKPELRGWIRSVEKDGSPADTTIDLYDQAFGLLALAWAFKTGADPESKAAVRNTALDALAGMDGECADPENGGYLERRNGVTASPMVTYPKYRRQNPHMHLLEAFLAWHGADPEGPWLDRARDMVALLRTRFLVQDSAEGDDTRRPAAALAEYFDDSWGLAPGEAGLIREPGHHYEWVWLLKRYDEASGDAAARADAENLYRFALDKGTDRDGLAFGAFDEIGRVMDRRKNLWPQTETLKAHLAMYEWTGDPAARKAAEGCRAAIFSRYIGEDGALFYNLLDEKGNPDSAPALSRLLYHLFVALAEAERVLG
jgi:mannose/cellobiose epimerase-like protein (N-acyl-D-glucosamine 2-epimerase family)